MEMEDDEKKLKIAETLVTVTKSDKEENNESAHNNNEWHYNSKQM